MKYLALLRGINVSGQKLIKMEALRELLKSNGLENVVTYIQSGNIIFDSDLNRKEIADKILDEIKAHYGFDVGIIILDQKSLSQAVNQNPFINEDCDTKRLYVTFLNMIPSDENKEKLHSASVGDDEFQIIDDVIYIMYSNSAGTSKLSLALIENRLKVVATMRNWNTTIKLLSMLEVKK